METNQVGNNGLLSISQADQGIGRQDVIPMLVMVDRTDEMPHIMQVGTCFKKQMVFRLQFM